jgi:hypothetical protein
MKRRTSIAWIALSLSLTGAAACSDADVAGVYTAQLTNRSDGCSLGLTSGENAMASFTVTQSGGDVTLVVEGIASLFVRSQLGTSAFTGGVDGDDVSLQVIGTAPLAAGDCKYTVNAKIKASQDGDAMSGRVEYRAATNDHADCGTRTGCLTVQEFNATRPPPAE